MHFRLGATSVTAALWRVGLWRLVVLSAFLCVPACESDPPRQTARVEPQAIPKTPDVTPPREAEVDSPEPVLVSNDELPAKPVVIPPKPLPAIPAAEPLVAVRIAALAISSTIEIGAAGDALSVRSVDAANDSAKWTTKGPLKISLSTTGWRVVSGANPSSARAFPAGELMVESSSARSEPVMWNRVRWPGDLRIVAVTGQRASAAQAPESIDLVMDIPMEEYLPGVIAKELYPSWDLEAYKAQAVAARSYALVEQDRWEGRRHYDMVAGQQSQAWVGATTNRNALDGVRQTRGEVLTHDGLVVPAYYSSACGGRPACALGTVTENPFHDIDPVSAGRLGPRNWTCCTKSSVASWKTSIPLQAVRDRLQAWGAANGRPDLARIGVPKEISVSSKNQAGRAVVLSIRPDKGDVVEIDSEDFRWAMNAPRDKSTTLKSGDCTVKITKSNGGTAVFTGRGFGHGVGMCQHGAQAMAHSGSTYREILKDYYPGSKIVKAWN